MTKILITVKNIEVSAAGSETEDGWLTVVAGPTSFDLVAVTGIEETLGSAELPPGRYNQVRMEVVETLVTVEGEERTAKVPSDRLRLVGTIDLAAGRATVLTLDFDAEKSVVLRGKKEPLLKPVVKLLVRTSDRSLAEAATVGETEEPSGDEARQRYPVQITSLVLGGSVTAPEGFDDCIASVIGAERLASIR